MKFHNANLRFFWDLFFTFHNFSIHDRLQFLDFAVSVRTLHIGGKLNVIQHVAMEEIYNFRSGYFFTGL